MKHAHYDNSGLILGFFADDISSVIPQPSVEVSEEVWKKALDENHNHITEGGVTYFIDPKSSSDYALESRQMRDFFLHDEVDPIIMNPIRWGELTTEKQEEWVNYRQSLLDIPDDPAFPNHSEIDWPTKPE